MVSIAFKWIHYGGTMKIYTGTGDSGKTSLFSGERRRKDDLRVDAYGCIDELSSFIGVIDSSLSGKEWHNVSDDLQAIQGDLFVMGALLATSYSSNDEGLLKPLEPQRVSWLEEKIDSLQNELPELHTFILPGGHLAASWCHVARTVCRRAERRIVSLCREENCVDGQNILSYCNRLSDYFFVLARCVNIHTGTEEITWHG